MSEIIATTDIVAEKGFVYVCGRDAEKRLTIIKVKAGRKKKDVV